MGFVLVLSNAPLQRKIRRALIGPLPFCQRKSNRLSKIQRSNPIQRFVSLQIRTSWRLFNPFLPPGRWATRFVPFPFPLSSFQGLSPGDGQGEEREENTRVHGGRGACGSRPKSPHISNQRPESEEEEERCYPFLSRNWTDVLRIRVAFYLDARFFLVSVNLFPFVFGRMRALFFNFEVLLGLVVIMFVGVATLMERLIFHNL